MTTGLALMIAAAVFAFLAGRWHGRRATIAEHRRDVAAYEAEYAELREEWWAQAGKGDPR
jgi:hypothetical protein